MLTEVTENFAKLQEKRRFKTRPKISSAAARGYFVWLGSGSQQREQFRRAPWPKKFAGTSLTIRENTSSHVLLLIKVQAKNLSPNYMTFTMNIGSLFRSLSTSLYGSRQWAQDRFPSRQLERLCLSEQEMGNFFDDKIRQPLSCHPKRHQNWGSLFRWGFRYVIFLHIMKALVAQFNVNPSAYKPPS